MKRRTVFQRKQRPEGGGVGGKPQKQIYKNGKKERDYGRKENRMGRQLQKRG